MRAFRNRIVLAVFIALTIFSCKENKKEDLLDSIGYEYFPLEIGKCRTYQIDSIIYNDFNQSIDTSKGIIRCCYVGEFLDSTNTPYVRVQYDIPGAGWHEPNNRRVAKVQLRNNILVEYTDSGNIVKMVFPVRNNRQWNMNMFNNELELNGMIEKKGEAFSNDKITNENSLIVRYKDFNSPIAQFTFYEVYSKDTGLIYSENANIIRIDGKVSGTKIIHSLIAYE